MSFYINVMDYMITLLPRPRLKKCTLHDDRAETLNELGIVTIRCDLNAINGIYQDY